MFKRIKALLTNKNLYITLACICGAFILLLLFFNSVVMPWYTNHAEGISVPDVTRMPLDEAKATLTSYGLRYEVADRRTNALYPAGFVTDQNPRPSEIVKPNRKIYLTVNMKHHPKVEVPKVVNSSFRSAKVELQNAGLKIGAISYVSSKYNIVLRQSIKAGEMVEKGTSIDLAIGDGLGEKLVIVPEIVGRGLTAVKLQLRKSGLRIDTVLYRPKKDVRPNIVVGFKPHEKRVSIGTAFKLIVSQKTESSNINKKSKSGNE